MRAGDSVYAVQTIFLLLLAVVVVFSAMARRLRVPYPILLVIAGLLISFVPHVPRVPLNPDLVFLIVLPPLLYAAAWQTSWREFRHNLLTISMLAIGLVAFTAWGVAELAYHVIPSLDWRSGFVLGAVVATTDAIAATSIARRIGLPKRIVDLLEGESLVNDATGLLALEFGLRMIVQGQTPTVGGGLLRLLWLIGAGLGVGLLIGIVMAWLERFVDDGPLEMAISVVVPYAAYLAAEEVKASGILAVVACGLYLSRKSVTFFSPETRIQVRSGWNALNFMLNGIVFVLIGLQLPYVLAGIHEYSRWTLLKYGGVFSVILIALRLVWMFPASSVAHWLRTRFLKQTDEKPGWRGVFVVGWTGMRGVVALAAAISLPETLGNGEPFRQRNLIVFLTFSVILVTLVVQGLSLPALIRALGLSGSHSGEEEETEARRVLLIAALAYLEEGRAKADKQFAHTYDDLLHRYQDRLASLTVNDGPMDSSSRDMVTERQVREITRSTVEVERQALIRMRNEGKIGDDVLRRLELELDLEETRQTRYKVGLMR